MVLYTNVISTVSVEFIAVSPLGINDTSCLILTECVMLTKEMESDDAAIKEWNSRHWVGMSIDFKMGERLSERLFVIPI